MILDIEVVTVENTYCTNAHHCKHGRTCKNALTGEIIRKSHDKKDGRKIIRGTPYNSRSQPCEKYEYEYRFK